MDIAWSLVIVSIDHMKSFSSSVYFKFCVLSLDFYKISTHFIFNSVVTVRPKPPTLLLKPYSFYPLPSLHKRDAKRERSAELGLPADDRSYTEPSGGLLDLDLLLREVELEPLEKRTEERLHLDHTVVIGPVISTAVRDREGYVYAREPPTDAPADSSSCGAS